MNPYLSIVTSMYNSAAFLPEFYRRCVEAASAVAASFEIVLVNDGSPDDSLNVALELHARDPRVRVVDLFEALMKGDAAAALKELHEQYEIGADPAVILGDLAEFTHFVTRVKVIPAVADDVSLSEAERTRGRAFAAQLSMRVLSRTWQMLLKGLSEVQASGRPVAAAVLVSPLLYGSAFYGGFFNFVAGAAALAFWTWELEESRRDRPFARILISSAVGAALLYFVHVLWLAVGGFAIATCVLLHRFRPAEALARAREALMRDCCVFALDVGAARDYALPDECYFKPDQVEQIYAAARELVGRHDFYLELSRPAQQAVTRERLIFEREVAGLAHALAH